MVKFLITTIQVNLCRLISLLCVFVYPKAGLWPALGLFNLSFFCTTGKRKRFNHNHNQDLKQIFNTLTIFDFISNIQITYIYYMPIISYRITCLQLNSLLSDLKCS